LICSDKQINEFLDTLHQEQEKIETEIVKIAVYSDKLVSLSESFALPVPVRIKLLSVIKEKNEMLRQSYNQ
jgi:hypothetical protein